MERETVISRTKQLPLREDIAKEAEAHECWEGVDGEAKFILTKQTLPIVEIPFYTLSISSDEYGEVARLADEFIGVYGEPMDITFRNDATCFSWFSSQIDSQVEVDENQQEAS